MPRFLWMVLLGVGCAGRPLYTPLEDDAPTPAPDLASTPAPDLGAPLDLRVALDLAEPEDLSRSADLAPPPDLAPSPDLLEPSCSGAAFPCPVWANLYGDANNQFVKALAAAGENAVVGLLVEGTLQLPGVPPASDGNAVALVKPTGQTQWLVPLGGAAVADLSTDSAGNLYVAASLTGSVTLGQSTLTSAGWDDILLIKLDPAGNLLWSRQFGDGERQLAVSVAAHPQGGVILTGRFDSTLDLGGGVTLTSDSTMTHVGVKAGNDFVARFDDDGNLQWAKQTHGDWVTFGDSAVASGGDVFLLGQILGSGDPGGGATTSARSDLPEYHLLVLAANGTLVRAEQTGDSGWWVPSLSAYADGAVALITAADDVNSYDVVVRWNGAGDRVFAHTVGSPGSTRATISAAADGRLAVASVHVPFFVEKGEILTEAGNAHPSLLMLDGAAGLLGQRALSPAAGDDANLALAFTPSGALWLAGWIDQTADVGLGPLRAQGIDVLLAYFAAPQQ